MTRRKLVFHFDVHTAEPMPAWELRKRRLEGQRMHDQFVRAEIVRRDTSLRNTFEVFLGVPKSTEVNL